MKISRLPPWRKAVATTHSNGKFSCFFLFSLRIVDICSMDARPLNIVCQFSVYQSSVVNPSHHSPDATNQQRVLGTQPPPTPPPALTRISTAALGRYPTVPATQRQRPEVPSTPLGQIGQEPETAKAARLIGLSNAYLNSSALLCCRVSPFESPIRSCCYQPLGVRRTHACTQGICEDMHF